MPHHPKETNRNREYWCNGEGLVQLKEWVEKGHNDKEIMTMIGIARPTFYDWKKNEPLFKSVFYVGRRQAVIELVDTMVRTATGFHYTEEVVDNKGQIVEVKKYQPPNAQIQTFLAKNWDRQNYRDRWDIEHSGALPVIIKGEDELKD